MIAQATQQVVSGWTPEAVSALIASITALVAAIGGVIAAWSARNKAGAASEKAAVADVKAESAVQTATIANDRAGNNARAQTVTQAQVTEIAKAMPPPPPTPWMPTPEGFTTTPPK